MTDFGEFSEEDKLRAISMALILGHEDMYRDNAFFRNGVDTLSLILVDMIKSLKNNSDRAQENHDLMIKEMRERKLYD